MSSLPMGVREPLPMSEPPEAAKRARKVRYVEKRTFRLCRKSLRKLEQIKKIHRLESDSAAIRVALCELVG